MPTSDATPWVLQLCHGYDGPFLDCARQYAVLFKGTKYKVCTVYLTGVPNADVEHASASDEVFFLEYDSEDIRGLKIEAMRKIRQVVSSRHVILCIAHRFKSIYLALLATQLPVIGVHHAFGVYKRTMRRWFVRLFKSRLWLVGVSDAVRDELRQHLKNWPKERIQTFYNRIDVCAVQSEQMSRLEARKALGLPSQAWIVGNVGRLHPDKDQATLIRGFAHALPKLPKQSFLVIVGCGRLETHLKTLAETLGIYENVLFLGQIAQARRYFKAFDVFALTSDHEPFGMVLLEAMAAGIPLICSDCGGGREVAKAEGLLFPLGDASALSSMLIQSLELSINVPSTLNTFFSDEAARNWFWKSLAVELVDDKKT